MGGGGATDAATAGLALCFVFCLITGTHAPQHTRSLSTGLEMPVYKAQTDKPKSKPGVPVTKSSTKDLLSPTSTYDGVNNVIWNLSRQGELASIWRNSGMAPRLDASPGEPGADDTGSSSQTASYNSDSTVARFMEGMGLNNMTVLGEAEQEEETGFTLGAAALGFVPDLGTGMQRS